MKIELNIEKKYAFGIIATLLILGGIFGVYATWNPAKTMFHSADDVKVNIGGTDYSLQEAISDGKIGGGGLNWGRATTQIITTGINTGRAVTYDGGVATKDQTIMVNITRTSENMIYPYINGVITKETVTQYATQNAISFQVKAGQSWKVYIWSSPVVISYQINSATCDYDFCLDALKNEILLEKNSNLYHFVGASNVFSI